MYLLFYLQCTTRATKRFRQLHIHFKSDKANNCREYVMYCYKTDKIGLVRKY